MARILLAVLAGLSPLLPLSIARAAVDKELVEEVRAGNRMAFQSIHSFYCRVSVIYKSELPLPLPTSAEYWRALDRIRIKEKSSKWSTDGVRRGSQMMHVNPATERDKAIKPQYKFYGQIAKRDPMVLGWCDPWSLGLVVLHDSAAKLRQPPYELLQTQSNSLRRAERRIDRGREYIVIELMHSGRLREYWFDPKVNYLVRKRVLMENDQRQNGTEAEVSDFVEVARGIYFPSRVKHVEVHQGKPGLTYEATFSDFRVNQPLGDDVFEFRFPEGTYVLDSIEGKRYLVGADGNPVGSKEELSTAPPISLAQAAPRTETLTEPLSWTVWILPGSIAILVVAGGILLVQRWRRRPA